MGFCGRVRAASLVVCFTIALAFAAAPAAAQGCPELVGRWNSGAGFVATSDDHIYFGGHPGLVVAELSDPAAPRVVGEADLGLLANPQDFVVSGGYAYVSSGSVGLQVVDVSDPTAPIVVGRVATPAFAFGVALADGYAYVGAWESGLRVIDVSDPTAPVEVGFADTPGIAQAVAVSGGYAYVADEGEGLRVIDISDPTAPVEVGFVDTPGYAIGVTVAGGVAYVSDYDSGLRVIDVSDPTAPLEVGFVDTPGESWQSMLAGGLLYLADGPSGLRVIDVSDPTAPVEVGSIDTPGDGVGIEVAGGMAYVGDGTGGVRAIDVWDPTAPVEVGSFAEGGVSDSLAVAGGTAYVGFYPSGFRVVDVSDPSAAVELGALPTPGYPKDIALAGGHAYVADQAAGLLVIDVSDPSEPVQVAVLDTPGTPSAVAVAGGYAYVADGIQGVRVIDVSRPSAPVEVGFFDTYSLARDVQVAGRYAYVLDMVAGLYVVDITSPSTPVEVGRVRTSAGPLAVAVSGRHAFVGSGLGLQVIDVSMPSAPVEVGFFAAPPAGAQAWSVAAANGYAYVSWRFPSGVPDGFSVIDVTTPSEPLEVAFIGDFWGTEDVVVADGHVFLAGRATGLYVFDECGVRPAANPRESFVPAAAVAAGAEGAFFQTDLELNNRGGEAAQVVVEWLPRGEDNTEPVASDPIAIEPGQSVRYDNVLTELFGLGPDSAGALRLVASTDDVIAMSRTYNVPGTKAAGTFGQGLAAVRATEMIAGTEPRKILFLSEDDDCRANVGCVNATATPLRVNIELLDTDGSPLETQAMFLRPWSNDQINRIFKDHRPVNGTVVVSANRADAIYYCYGSMLDNETSDPTTILPQSASADRTFVPAAALAAGLEGAFFRTDIDLSNVGPTDLTYELLWLPRGADNSEPTRSETFSLAAGAGVRYANVLGEVFGLEPDQAGALALEASGIDLLAMSRTYNLPSAKVAGTFGQELPGIPLEGLMATGEKRRIIFMNETDDVRSNVGCVNGGAGNVRVSIELFNADGESLEVKTMDLAPLSNNQITRLFRDHAPVTAGYVDVWTNTPHAAIFCYGSVLDNLTSDPTTVLPQ
jgi:hypothetical protein